MISRRQLIALLVLVEIAIVGEMVLAIRGDQPGQWSAWRTGAHVASDSSLAEGGAHKVFDAGSRPALTVDIGNADLTIRAGDASQFDVSVSKSTDFGTFRAKAPITANRDGDTISIATNDRHHWSIGDDRMVTVLVPPETKVTVANAGDITAIGLHAEASINSDNGFVAVENYDAPALRVESSNGRISLRRIVAPRIDVTTSDGHIEGSALQVGDGNIETSDGTVTLGFAAGADTLVTAETSDGTIHVSGVSATAAAQTATKTSGDEESSTRTVRLGAGTGRLTVRSDDGNINILQEG
jgi:Putative adhesin